MTDEPILACARCLTMPPGSPCPPACAEEAAALRAQHGLPTPAPTQQPKGGDSK